MRRYGNFIERPYLLGQPCDGSIVAPVTALYLDFCARHGLNAQALRDEAYPEGEVLEPEAVAAFAHWQGVRIPHTWTAACYAGLLKSLTEVNQSTLRNTLEEAAEDISFPGGVLEREEYVAFRGNTRCYSPSARFTWGHVVTPTGEQVWRYDPWQSTNGTVPAHYWLSFIAVAARHDGNLELARQVITEAERSARSPAEQSALPELARYAPGGLKKARWHEQPEREKEALMTQFDAFNGLVHRHARSRVRSRHHRLGGGRSYQGVRGRAERPRYRPGLAQPLAGQALHRRSHRRKRDRAQPRSTLAA